MGDGISDAPVPADPAQEAPQPAAEPADEAPQPVTAAPAAPQGSPRSSVEVGNGSVVGREPSSAGGQILHEIFGALVIVAGFALLAYVAFLAIRKYATSTDAVAVIASMTGVIGTVIAAYFGVRAVQSQAGAAETTAQASQLTAQQAQRSASQAHQIGAMNTDAAAKGRELAREIKRARDTGRGAPSTGAPSRERVPGTTPGAPADLETLGALADRYFPDETV
jgi:hypothetical protein